MKAKKAGAVKFKPQQGRMPTLQFQLPSELQIDPTYQRSIDNAESQRLIGKIAMNWNWDLCQPLVVARRNDGALFVIDGQHRLEAAKLRGDIVQLPCVVVNYASAADEAANFVQLNQARRPLAKLDVFKAAVASEDPEAVAILGAIEAAGLSLAPHSNPTAWKPGQICNIGGIESAWRNDGDTATELALLVMARAFEGQTLTYAGTIFPGIVAVCAAELAEAKRFSGSRLETFINMLGLKTQQDWRTIILTVRVDDPNLNFPKASAAAIKAAWQKASAAPVVPPPPPPPPVVRPRPAPAPAIPNVSNGKVWCSQCEQRVSLEHGRRCARAFCKAKFAA